MDELIDQARRAVDAAYAPCSEYNVGAALRGDDGTVFSGCNVEDANYSNSVDVEELAVSKAVKILAEMDRARRYRSPVRRVSLELVIGHYPPPAVARHRRYPLYSLTDMISDC